MKGLHIVNQGFITIADEPFTKRNHAEDFEILSNLPQTEEVRPNERSSCHDSTSR